MTQIAFNPKDKIILRSILIISVLVPVVVGLLLVVPYKLSLPDSVIMALPRINAGINSITSIILILGLVFILQRKVEWHKRMMLSAMALGALFLVFYVIYHASAPSTKFGDANGDGVVEAMEKAAVASIAGFYYFVLLTHIVLAAIVLPFVLMSVYYALSGKIDRHRKIVRYAYPLWLYVSISGVVVFYMISPFYQQ
ncbi:DUF420 domain-containing protein [Nafulsella turpanensis]|uniref:DUF420 domain-containing protein n=1 Tax=Nafulsella turpanensis TaxID=1265690 RepID=UPI000348C086|nr:DUF420 domain-containing protein [Nafulsella turpanensis]